MDIEEITAESFTTDFEKYATERIGFRTQFIDSYITLNDRLFNILEHPIYEYGKDGYVFFHMPSEKYDKTYIKLFAKFIQRMENYLNNKDIDFLYCINPNKTAVYKDYLPSGVNLQYPRQKLLKEYLDKYNVTYIDNTEFLITEADNAPVFDKKYDAGHWNEHGAYIGMTNILDTLSKKHNIPVNEPSDYIISYPSHEMLPLSHFRIDEPSILYERKNAEAINITSEDTDIILDETYHDYSHFINSAHPELPKILIFRGSYFLAKEKFMTESFSESVFVHSYYNIFNLEYYVEKFSPDIVLFESVEYATKNTYFPKKLLKTTRFE